VSKISLAIFTVLIQIMVSLYSSNSNMALPSTKADHNRTTTLAETVEIVRALQQGLQLTDNKLKHVEEAGKVFGEVQSKLDAKVDAIHKLLVQWQAIEMNSA
jgi:hypothetical protein